MGACFTSHRVMLFDKAQTISLNSCMCSFFSVFLMSRNLTPKPAGLLYVLVANTGHSDNRECRAHDLFSLTCLISITVNGAHISATHTPILGEIYQQGDAYTVSTACSHFFSWPVKVVNANVSPLISEIIHFFFWDIALLSILRRLLFV